MYQLPTVQTEVEGLNRSRQAEIKGWRSYAASWLFLAHRSSSLQMLMGNPTPWLAISWGLFLVSLANGLPPPSSRSVTIDKSHAPNCSIFFCLKSPSSYCNWEMPSALRVSCDYIRLLRQSPPPISRLVIWLHLHGFSCIPGIRVQTTVGDFIQSEEKPELAVWEPVVCLLTC
jgi:hypothetical protein